MERASNFRAGRNCVFLLHVHLVFVTKYRRKVFTKEILVDLKNIFSSICNDFEATLVEMNGEYDHVHLLVEYPPKYSVSVLVNALKGTSSRLLRAERRDLAARYWKGVPWSPSYFTASSGGAPLERVKQYVEAQRAEAE